MAHTPDPSDPGSRPPILTPWTWFVLGFVGTLVFVIGIYRPATRWLGGPNLYGTPEFGLGIAILGGILAGVGFSKWYDNRPGGPATRGRPPPARPERSGVRDSPSFEIYDPRGEPRKPRG